MQPEKRCRDPDYSSDSSRSSPDINIRLQTNILTSVLILVNEPICLFSASGHIQFANCAFEQLFCFPEYGFSNYLLDHLFKDFYLDLQVLKLKSKPLAIPVLSASANRPMKLSLAYIRKSVPPLFYCSVKEVVLPSNKEAGANEILAAVFDTCVDGIIVTDEKGKIEKFNKAAETLTGYNTSEVIGEGVESIMTDRYANDHSNFMKRYMQTGEAKIIGCGREVNGKRKDGSTFPLYLGLSKAIVNDKIKFIGIIRDLTESKLMEKRIIEQASEMSLLANQANRIKGEFLGSMSHELRSPLNVVIGMANLLLESDMGSQHKEYVEMINNSAGGLLRMLQEIMEYIRLENKQVEPKLLIQTTEMDLMDLLEEIVSSYHIKCKSKGLLLLLEYRIDKTRFIGDPWRIRQIVTNLIENSIKFTNQGSIVIKAEIVKEKLSVSVVDTGIGIPADKLNVIFGKFTQLDSSDSRSYGGIGLGLSICQELARLMGGDIVVESEKGIGSTFRFSFKAESSQEMHRGIVHSSLKQIHALCLHSEETILQVLRNQFSFWDLEFTILESEPDAVASWKAEKSTPFTLLAADTYILFGREPLEEFDEKCLAWIPKNIKVLLLNVHIDPSTLAQHFSKHRPDLSLYIFNFPFRPSKLFGFLLSSVEDSKLSSLTLYNEHNDNKKITLDHPLKILLAEDNQLNQKVATLHLKKLGCSVIVANDGNEALELYKNKCTLIDFIFMDLQMPGMDGFQATDAIRKFEEENYLELKPICALTANVSEGVKMKCLASGFSDYIAKPFTQKELKKVIEKHWEFGEFIN